MCIQCRCQLTTRLGAMEYVAHRRAAEAAKIEGAGDHAVARHLRGVGIPPQGLQGG